ISKGESNPIMKTSRAEAGAQSMTYAKEDEYIEIEVSISGVNNKFKEKVLIINDVKKIKIIPWLNKFERICATNNWNNEQIKLVLLNLIKDPILEKHLNCDSYEQIRTNLIKSIYPSNKQLAILSELENIKQINFKYYAEYLDSIKEKVSEYAFTADLTSREQERKEFETINRNRAYHTRLKLIERGLKTLVEQDAYLLGVKNELLV
ncbi:hypothetical protein H311_04641, partial [Anncaliia algerae PRA109]